MSTTPDPAINRVDADQNDRGFDMRRRDPDQPSLFPTEDLIIPDALRSMRKAVSAIHASPIKAEHAQSLNSRRLFDACILVAQLDFKKREHAQIVRMKNERISPMFETRITDLSRLASIPGKNFERVYSELDQLFEMRLNWNVVGEDSEIEWAMKSHFLSSIGYGRGQKRGLIRFSIDPAILDIVLEPSNWATLSLQAMEGLGTAASYALYQNAWRYVNTTAKVTAALPVETWIELLVGKSRYVVEDPEMGKRVQNYADFKRRTLVDAIRRVNEIQALSYELELKELKSGHRVSKLQFKFIPKKSQSLGLPVNWPADVLRVLTSIGFSEREIENLSQARSHEEVTDSILKLKAAEGRMRALGKPIASKKAYFNGILANIASGATMDDLDHEKIEAEARLIEAQRVAEDRQERRIREFSRFQSERFITRLFEMVDSTRMDLFAEFEASTEGAKAKLLVTKGWNPKNVGALSIFKSWLTKTHPALMEALLPNPEDKNLEAWMAWRLDAGAS